VKLKSAGWRVLVVWECSLRGKRRLKPETLIDQIARWLFSGRKKSEISAKSKRAP
jgi:DNA mismatch endonuclease (patch repair protein)